MFLLVLLASSYILTLKSVLPQSEGQFLILQGDGITAPLLLQVMGLREGFRASNSDIQLVMVHLYHLVSWVPSTCSWVAEEKNSCERSLVKYDLSQKKDKKRSKNTMNIIKCYKMMWNDINWFWQKMINVYKHISAPSLPVHRLSSSCWVPSRQLGLDGSHDLQLCTRAPCAGAKDGLPGWCAEIVSENLLVEALFISSFHDFLYCM